MKPIRAKRGEGKKWLEERASHEGDQCLVWPFSCMTSGYGQLSLGDRGRERESAHRYMCYLAHGAPDSPDLEASHSCGNRRCVNPKHLSWKTKTENQIERRNHGTHQTWGRRGKLTPVQVTQIRQLKGIETSIETAARYGVTESNVRLIQDGKTWPSVRT